jgi:hypothetical protein
MLAARTGLRFVFLVLAICLTASTPSYSQNSASFNASKVPVRGTSSGAWLAKCEPSSTATRAEARFNDGGGSSATGNAIPGDFNVAAAGEALCTDSALSIPSPRSALDDRCVGGVARTPVVPGVPHAFACNEPTDAVAAELSGLGKAGVKIARAREDVLDILRSGNACADWFATKDAKPAETFQSLSFLLDKRGPREVFESEQPESMHVWRQPYVARATQDGGAYTAITINAYGAFYRTQGTVLKTAAEGGPVHTDGTRLLKVGSYLGDTEPAQVVTLLHEFGHIIDLLPGDRDNLDGKSVRNTDEVLRHCRAEVETRTRQAKQTANR